MSVPSKKNFFKYNADMVENVRKIYNLDQPGVMEQAIGILEEWIAKQEHFVKKNFPREYLEKFIIASKGSVEKAKTRIDRLCTLRTEAPNLFEKCHAKKDFVKFQDVFVSAFMPYPTEDNCRIHIGKLLSKDYRKFGSAVALEVFQHHIIRWEYAKLHDYAKAYYSIIDLGDVDIIYSLTFLNLTDIRNWLSVITEGHGVKVNGVYFITNSNMIHVLMKFIRQIVSPKLFEKVHVLKTYEELHGLLPRKLLPKDYGGDQKSLLDIFDDLNEELGSEEHVSFIKEMRQACTNEKLRSQDSFNKEYLGIPGSFKTLNVD